MRRSRTTRTVSTVAVALRYPQPLREHRDPLPHEQPHAVEPGVGAGRLLARRRSSPSYPNLGGDLGASAWSGWAGTGLRPGRLGVPGLGAPPFQVHYVDEPIADGSGDPVDVPGDATSRHDHRGRHPGRGCTALRARRPPPRSPGR